MRKVLILTLTIIFAALTSAVASIQQMEDQKKQYEDAAEESKQRAEWLQGRINSVSEVKRVLDEEAEIATADFNQKQNTLNSTLNRIEENELRLLETERDYEKKLHKLEKRIRDIYINGQISYIDVLFGAHDFGDFLTRMDLLKRVLYNDSELVTETLQYKSEIESLGEKLKADKHLQADQLRLAEKSKNNKQKKVDDLQNFINRMENDKELYNRRYDEMMAASKQVEKLIQESKYRIAAEQAAKEQREAERKAQAERERLAKEQRELERQQRELERQQQALEREQQNAERKARRNSEKNSDEYVEAFVPEGTGEMIYPLVGPITSEFGWRTHPIFGGSKFHSGIDIGGDFGMEIKAARGGVVSHAGWIDGYGNTIMIEHGGGLVTLYGHNQSFAVSVGQTVKQGQVVAYCGSTGNSTGPHCHFEVRLNGEAVSPYDYL